MPYNYEGKTIKVEVERPEWADAAKNYGPLLDVLREAFDRASRGKGLKRHGDGKPFTEQWILRGLRVFGLGGVQFQIGKKNEEVCNLPEIKDKVNELLDIIVYAAAGVIYLKEKAENEKGSMH